MQNEQYAPQSFSHMRTIMENIRDLILLLGIGPDNTFIVLYVNPAFVEATGLKDIVGKEITDIVSRKTAEEMRDHYSTVVKTRQPLSYYIEADIPAGHKVFNSKLIPVLNALGECVQIIGITRESELP